MYSALTVSWGLFWRDLFKTDSLKAFRLGQWLGNRYRNKNNVIWIVAGEYDSIDGYGNGGYPLTAEQRNMIDAMARGLESGHGGNHLMTIHPSLWSIPLQRSSSIEWGTSTWLDFNILQT